MSDTPNAPIVFTPGSKVIFVSGGYQGGIERVGVVLGLTPDNHVLLCMLDDEVGAPSHIEGFAADWLASEIEEGRIEGSSKETRYIPSVNPCLPLLHFGSPCPECKAPKWHKIGCSLDPRL